MAPALAPVRLPRPPADAVLAVPRFLHLLHADSHSPASGVRVRALAPLAASATSAASAIRSHSRVRICRVPFFRISSPRREALVSAMGEGEHDITDMQEADKVSGDWWKSVLDAVHDWSSDKLLGLAELADGSLFFSFGGSVQKRSAAKTSAPPRVQSETKVKESPHNLKPITPPKRLPSSFRKHSPIPDSRKRATVSKEAAATAQPQGEDKTTQKAKHPSKPARPPRPSSSFSKRSPIPKDRGSVPASTSKKNSRASEDPPAAATPTKAAFDSEKDSPFSPELKEILSHGKETAGQQRKENGKSKTETKTSSAAKKKPSKSASEETEVAETVENGAVSKDLGSFKLPELRSLAKARGLKGYSKLKKGELVDLLASSES